jgi:death on curing protein
MDVRCLDLVDFLLVAEAVTGTKAETLARLPRIYLVESALAAPNSGIDDTYYYPRFEDKAAAMAYRLIKCHALIDGNKRVGYSMLLMFLRGSGFELVHAGVDNLARQDETVRIIEGVAGGQITQEELASWIGDRLVNVEARDGG